MKFLYVGDLHARTTPPESRKDKWEETYISKIKEIRDIAKKHNVKAILHGGDFFSHFKYDTEFLSKVLNWWGYKNYNEKLLEEGVIVKNSDEAPIITPIGNHDLLGGSLVSYPKTSLSFLENIGFITIANQERPLIFKEDGMSVAITGGHYELNMDETKEPYIINEKQGDYHIHIVHGMLTDHKWPEGVPHTTIDEICHTKADLTIAGHDHTGFGLVEHEGKLFVNPGSPTRMRTDEIKRKPKLMLVEVDKIDGIKTKYIYLKSAKDGSEVLDLTKKESKERKSNILKDVKERMKENTTKGISINDIITSIAKESEIDENIAKNAIDKVANKIKLDKSLSESNIDKLTSPYYITGLHLCNFGSHERTTFQFSSGLNVFIGATSSGKTTCFRAFKWIFDDDGNSKRFIKKGESFCEATITTSHGYTITRFIHHKGRKSKDNKSIKNGYEIVYPNGEIEVTNTKGVETVREILSYKKLNLESKEIDLNFLEQGVSWFFIGDKYTSTDRAKMIGAIHKTHFVDLAIKDLEADNKRLNQRREDKVEEINKLEEKIESFSYLNKTEKTLNRINALMDKISTEQESVSKIEKLIEKRDSLKREMEKNEYILSKISPEIIYSVENIITDMKSNMEHTLRTATLINKSNEIKNNLLYLEKIKALLSEKKISQSENLLIELNNDMNTLKNQIMCYNRMKKSEESFKQVELTMSRLDKEKIKKMIELLDNSKGKIDFINNLNLKITRLKEVKLKALETRQKLEFISEDRITSIETKLAESKNELENINKISKIHSKIKEIVKEGKAKRNDLNNIDKELNINIDKYKELLVENGKCPTCNSRIDKILAESIIKEKFKGE